MFSDQQTIYQDMKDMEEQPRVRRYIIGARQLIGLFTSRRTDKNCLEVTECALPEGYKIRAMTTMSCPAGLIVYVEHPSFDPVPLGQEPPTFQQRYELVTLRKTDQDKFQNDIYTIVDVRPQSNESVQSKSTVTKDKIIAALKKLGVWTIGSRSDLARWSITDLATDLEAELNKPE